MNADTFYFTNTDTSKMNRYLPMPIFRHITNANIHVPPAGEIGAYCGNIMVI